MKSVKEILTSVREKKMSLVRAERLLRLDTVQILDDLARIDARRYTRRGVPEIIYAASKSARQLSLITRGLLDLRLGKNRTDSFPIIFSKVNGEKFHAISKTLRQVNKVNRTKFRASYFQTASIVTISATNRKNRTPASRSIARGSHEGGGRIALFCAGTSDIPALTEAETILKILGCSTIRFNDVGVAALHRLQGPLRQTVKFDPDVIVVAAGMEGALPSVIAGLVSAPVIGLPTAVGYGFGDRGEAALMSMLQACPLGMAVVNINGGIAAGIVAYLIAKRSHVNH